MLKLYENWGWTAINEQIKKWREQSSLWGQADLIKYIKQYLAYARHAIESGKRVLRKAERNPALVAMSSDNFGLQSIFTDVDSSNPVPTITTHFILYAHRFTLMPDHSIAKELKRARDDYEKHYAPSALISGKQVQRYCHEQILKAERVIKAISNCHPHCKSINFPLLLTHDYHKYRTINKHYSTKSNINPMNSLCAKLMTSRLPFRRQVGNHFHTKLACVDMLFKLKHHLSQKYEKAVLFKHHKLLSEQSYMNHYDIDGDIHLAEYHLLIEPRIKGHQHYSAEQIKKWTDDSSLVGAKTVIKDAKEYLALAHEAELSGEAHLKLAKNNPNIIVYKPADVDTLFDYSNNRRSIFPPYGDTKRRISTHFVLNIKGVSEKLSQDKWYYDRFHSPANLISKAQALKFCRKQIAKDERTIRAISESHPNTTTIDYKLMLSHDYKNYKKQKYIYFSYYGSEELDMLQPLKNRVHKELKDNGSQYRTQLACSFINKLLWVSMLLRAKSSSSDKFERIDLVKYHLLYSEKESLQARDDGVILMDYEASQMDIPECKARLAEYHLFVEPRLKKIEHDKQPE